MSKREKNSLFARFARWKEQLRLNREQKQAVKAEKSAQVAERKAQQAERKAQKAAEKAIKADIRAEKEKTAQKCVATQTGASYSFGKPAKQGVKTPASLHKTALGALCLILVCSVLSLTAVTIAKYTKELHHNGNSVTVTGHTGEWVQTQAGVKEAYNNGTLHGAFSPAQHTRTCTVCGAVETKYVFDNAIHNGDFPVSYTNEGSWNVYNRENRLLNHTPNSIDYNLTNWIGYNLDQTWATVNVAATKDTDTFYVGDNTGAVVISNGSVGNAISLCNRFILVEGFTYRIGFWCKYEDVLYTTSSNLIMAVRKYNNGKWDIVADLKLSDDDSKTPFFQMGVSEKGWTYVTSTFTFADDGDNVKLEQESFDLLLQLYQIQLGRMVIDEVSCYPVTHTPENEKDEQYYTRYETDRFNVPNFLLLNNGSGVYQADLGTSGVDASKTQITYSVAEGSGYALTNGNKTLTFNRDGDYTVTIHFATDNAHGDHSHTKTVSITKTVKVRNDKSDIIVNYYDENGAIISSVSGTFAGGMGKTLIPTLSLSKTGYRFDGWYYEEDDQMAYLHKKESLLMKDYTVSLKPVFTQLIYDEEIYGAITTDQETGAYVEAYDFGNKDMWAGWSNKTGMVSFQSGEINNWNDDKVMISSPNYGDGETAHSAHYHYAMDLQRGVTYYLSGRVQIGRAVIKNAGSCQLWFGITETSADSPLATPTNIVCRLDPHVGQGKTLTDYDEYVLQTFTVPEDGMYFFSIYAWGVLELTDVTLSQFSIRGAETGEASINFAGYSSRITTNVGKTAYLPYVSIPGKKVEGWQQRVPVRGNVTNTFIYPMGIQLWANVKGNFTEYVPYITKTYEYGSIASSNNLLKDFGNLPSAIYPARPLGNSLEWNTYGEDRANASVVWDAVNHTATFQADYYGKVFDTEGNQASISGYYNYPVYLEAGKSYVLKLTISFDELRYSTSGSCGVGMTVFGGRYINGVFNTSTDHNYYSIESRICPILGYDSGTFGNTIYAPGKLLTNGNQDFAVTFTAPETKTYYAEMRLWGIHTATNLKISNVSLTPVEMNAAQSEYNYLGITGKDTIDASIADTTPGWTVRSIQYSECVTYDEATNSLNLNFNKFTHDGTSWSGSHGWAVLQKNVNLTKGTYELSATFTIRKMALSTGGGSIFQMFVSTYSTFDNGTANDDGYLIHGSSMGWSPSTYTSNMPATAGGKEIEPLYQATRKTYFSIPADGQYYFYLQMWSPYYLDATITDIAIKSCAIDGMDQVVDRIAGAKSWDFKWNNDGDNWPTNFSTDTLIINGDYTDENEKNVAEGKARAAFAAVAVKRVNLTEGVRYKLSATFAVSQLLPYKDNAGARIEVFLADMAAGANADYGAQTITNRIQSSAIGYEIEDGYDYALIPWKGAVSNQKLSSYYVPYRSGEFLLVFRCWNAEIATANISNIRLVPVAEDNMLPPVNNANNWWTTNGAGLWLGEGTEEVTMLEGSSGTLMITATTYPGMGNYRYGGNYVMGSMPVTLQKGKTYRLSYTMEITGAFGLLQTSQDEHGRLAAFAGFIVRDLKSGEKGTPNELIRLGYAGGTYTNKQYLQYENGVLSPFLEGYTDNPIDTGLHSFSGEFTPTETGIYYVNLNVWAFTAGTVRIRSLALVEV